MQLRQAMLESLHENFARAFGASEGVKVAMAPGRVNLLGDHTDYNDGFVLPMTVDRGVYLALRKRPDKTIRVMSVRYDECLEVELGAFLPPRPGSWASYVLGVVEELRGRCLLDGGFDAVVDGDLSVGAGLGSSAALEVATAVSLQQVFGFEMGPVDMVKLCQCVEHTYADVLCGIMDPFASRMGRQGHALFLDCRSLDYDNVPVTLGDYRFVIIDSGVRRSLAASAYNTRRAECQQAVEHFGRYAQGITALRDVSAAMFAEHGDALASVARRRCRHVVTENQRVLDAVTAIKAGRLDHFGSLMTSSHRSLRDDLNVSCPELDLLVELARATGGVLGSRMTGAGFGGCTVSIVHRDAVRVLAERLTAEYTPRFDVEPRVLVLEGNREAGPVS